MVKVFVNIDKIIAKIFVYFKKKLYLCNIEIKAGSGHPM